MLTRFIRIQLTIFTIVGIIGVAVMAFSYIQAPTLLGIGRITVTLELPVAGGLYRFSNVTYRGAQVGRVTAVTLTSRGTKATLSLGSSPKIPADLQAEVRSISAVGEQYVDLRPRTNSPPYLHNGSVIAVGEATIPQPVGPLLDQTRALLNSIPKGKLGALLDESFKGFNGAGYDFGSLFDSAAQLSGDLNGVADRTRTLTEDTAPFLDAQAAESDFAITVNDPPACTVGFLPPNQWRSPADTTTIDTPDGLYCKLPQDSPIAVRGARNYPCMGHPGKRAPTVEICNSDKPFEPLAMRQHVFGTYPLDPNLLAQGIPPDDRVNFFRDRIFGPVEGTPRPPGPLPPAGPLAPAGAPAGAPNPAPPLAANAPQAVPPGLPPIAPIDVPDVPAPSAGPGGGAPQAAPSSFGGNGSGPGPSLAVVHYDPRTGGYVGPDRQLYRQSNLVSSSAPKTWQDMLPT